MLLTKKIPRHLSMFAITKERSSIMSEFVCIAAMYVASNRLAFE